VLHQLIYPRPQTRWDIHDILVANIFVLRFLLPERKVFRNSELNLIILYGDQKLHYRPEGECDGEGTRWPMQDFTVEA
jgi:hypothetical protein